MACDCFLETTGPSAHAWSSPIKKFFEGAATASKYLVKGSIVRCAGFSE
jgi:hypothetical protein